MGYSDESSNRFSFLSFVISVVGFFFFSFYYIGVVLGAVAIAISFLAEDLLKEKSMFQYLSVIVGVVDILGGLVGWNIIMRST